MTKVCRETDQHRQQTVEAVALFSVLMHARENDDLQEAAVT